jgi:hypothetical protein
MLRRIAFNLQLWAGVYLLLYGLTVEVSISAPRFHRYFEATYYVSILLFASSASTLARFCKGPLFTVISAVVIWVATVLIVYIWPWFVPLFNMHNQYGVTAATERAAIAVFKVGLIVIGTCLITRATRRP